MSAFGFSRSSGQDLYDVMGAQFGYRDENTGFIYLLGHRFYDAQFGQFGQFMTRDPMGYGGGVNLYGYTANNPVNRIDPSGYLQDPADDVIAGVLGGADTVIVVGVVATVIIGAPVTIPIAVEIGIGAGAIAGGVNEWLHGGSRSDIIGGAGVGGVSGGLAVCYVKLRPLPPTKMPPAGPPPVDPPGSTWPPPVIRPPGFPGSE